MQFHYLTLHRARPRGDQTSTLSDPLTLGPGEDEVDLAAAALAADKPLVPVQDGQLGAVALGQRGRVGLDLVATIAAPHDEPHMSSRSAAQRCRRAGVAVHRRPRRWPGLARGGAYTFGGGKGSRTGGGTSLSRMPCRVRIRFENGYL
jgi:hypothetical protein